MKGLVVGSLCTALLLLGCRKDIQNTEAVRQGILEYLAKRPDLTAMDVSVGSVAFRKDQADALVYFRAKDGPPNNGMEMKYILERNGNRWAVKGRASSGNAGNPHRGMATPGLPGQGMPMDSNHMGAAGSNGAAPALPPGHPPLTPEQSQRPPQ